MDMNIKDIAIPEIPTRRSIIRFDGRILRLIMIPDKSSNLRPNLSTTDRVRNVETTLMIPSVMVAILDALEPYPAILKNSGAYTRIPALPTCACASFQS